MGKIGKYASNFKTRSGWINPEILRGNHAKIHRDQGNDHNGKAADE